MLIFFSPFYRNIVHCALHWTRIVKTYLAVVSVAWWVWPKKDSLVVLWKQSIGGEVKVSLHPKHINKTFSPLSCILNIIIVLKDIALNSKCYFMKNLLQGLDNFGILSTYVHMSQIHIPNKECSKLKKKKGQKIYWNSGSGIFSGLNNFLIFDF